MTPPDVTRLVLVRHGQTAWNSEGKFQGHADIPLDERGHQQALDSAPFVAAFKPSRIVSSDLIRAQQTAAPIAELAGVDVELDEALREIHVGDWQGRTMEDIAKTDPWFAEALAFRRDFRRSPNGETAEECGIRVRDALERLGAERPGETTVVVGHGLALRVGLALLAGIGMPGASGLMGLWNGSWTVVELRSYWRILRYNVVPDFTSGITMR